MRPTARLLALLTVGLHGLAWTPVAAAQAALQPATGSASPAASLSRLEVLPVAIAPDAVLTLTPDRSDRLYPLGQPARVRVQFKLSPYPAGGVPITLRLGPDMLEGDERIVSVPAEGLVLDVPAQTQPGFVRAVVAARVDGKRLREVVTLGFAPERIAPTQAEPADFDAFWAQQVAELAEVPVDLRLTPAPELSTDAVEVAYLSFQNVGGWSGPSRMHGVLAMPRGAAPGSLPALLNVPGAGVRPYGGNLAMAARGFITLQMGIHGIAVNAPKALYDDLGRGALAEYARFGLDDRQRYYYRRVYLGVLRASQVLASLPQWNGKHLLVAGGSQGGQLSIMAAALNPRITGLAANFPAYSDVTGYLHGRAGGWPHLFRKGADGQAADSPVDAKLRTTGYYDTLNFARRLKVPGHYGWGFNDTVTPPTSMHAAFNVISAPRQLVLAPEMDHDGSPALSARVTAWLLEQVAR